MNQLPTLTLYPNHLRLQSALDGLVRGDRDGAIIHPQMMTIGAFEAKLQLEILGNKKEASLLARSFIAAKILDEYYRKHGTGAFKRSVGFKGFIPALLSFFGDLGAGLVSPSDLRLVRGYAPGKEKEIAALYTAYRDELIKRKLTDPGMTREALITALIDKDTIVTSEIFMRFGAIRLVDIYQFTPYRFELFRQIAKVKKVIVTLPVPDGRRKAFGFIVTNLEKFESLEDSEEKLEVEFEPSPEGRLTPLSDNIFELLPEHGEWIHELKEAVTIIRCSSRYREIEEIGASIDKLKTELKLSWADFSVIFRETSRYGAIIEDVFHRYGIPFNFKRGLPLGLNPLVRSILAIFTAIESGYARDEVLRLIGSPYFARYTSLDIDSVHQLFLKAGIMEGGKSYWRARLSHAQKSYKGKELAEAKKMIKATMKLLDLLAIFERQMRPPSFFDKLIEIIKYLRIEPDPDFAGERAESIRFRDNNAYGQLMEILLEARGAMADLKLGRAPLGFDRTKNILLNQIEKRSVPEPSTGHRNSVTLLNAHDAVGASYRVLFISGLHENEFPQFMERSSLLHESERNSFNKGYAEAILKNHPLTQKGRQVFDKAHDKWEEEALLFYQSLKVAMDRVIFTYCARELNGGQLGRSQFIDDVLETILPSASPAEREKFIITAPSLAIDKDPDELLDPEEQKMWLLKNLFHGEGNLRTLDEKLPQIVRTREDWSALRRLINLSLIERARDDYFGEPDPALKTKYLSPHLGLLDHGKDLVLKHAVSHRYGRYSPTGLEKYGACPFRYFASAILKLESVREPVMELDAMSAGSLSHRILELFYAKKIEAGSLPVTASTEDYDLLEESANQAFGEYEKEGKDGNPLIWDLEKERTLSQLKIFMKFEAEDQETHAFLPVAVEACFDLNNGKRKNRHSPLEITIPCGGLRYLIGVIDRIDVNKSKNEVRVVDYKLSSNLSHFRKMVKPENMGKLSFQPPIYMILAEGFSKAAKLLAKVDRVTGGYRLIRATEFKKSSIYAIGWGDNPEDVSPQNGFIKKVTGVIERIENGCFEIDPEKCDYCDFAGLCRYVSSSNVFENEGE